MASKTIKPRNLMTATDVAATLGVSRQRMLELQKTNEHFPAPVIRLAMGPLWDRLEVDAFLAQWARKPGRPRKKS